MSRRIAFLIIAVALLATAFAAPTALRAVASVQDDDICWDPDIEFPTTCDEDD
jgi:hypothetical protein